MGNIEAVKKYQAKRDSIMLRPSKEDGQIIRAAAAASGKSVQSYILQAIREKMERESAEVAAETPSPVIETPPNNSNTPIQALSSPAGVHQSTDTWDDEDEPDTEQYPQSKEEWLTWSVQRESESIEDWRTRLNRALGRTSGINAALWMAAMPKDKMDLLQGLDAESMEQYRIQQEKQQEQVRERQDAPAFPMFRWDYGLTPEQREERLRADRQRFRELEAIRKKRSLSSKEIGEFRHLLTIHQGDTQ